MQSLTLLDLIWKKVGQNLNFLLLFVSAKAPGVLVLGLQVNFSEWLNSQVQTLKIMRVNC